MSDYSIKHIVNFGAAKFDRKGSYIWIWHADKIPPHLGFSSEDRYFSLKWNGKDENVPVQHVIDLIQRKKIKALLVQLHESLPYQSVAREFANIERAKSGKETCLHPIKILLSVPHVRKLDELLHALELSDRVERCIGFNIEDRFFSIPEYDVEQIDERLKQLEHVSRK